MRKLVLLLLTFVTVFLLLVLTTHRSARPRIEIPEPIFNLGVVSPDSAELPVSFDIMNTGNSELKIKRVKVSCPCLEPKLNQATLGPGEKTILTLSFSPPRIIGCWQDDVLLFTNDPENPIVKLTLKAFIESEYEAIPSSILVDSLDKHKPRKINVTVLGPVGDVAFTVLDVNSDSDSLEILGSEHCGIEKGLNRKKWNVTAIVKAKEMDSWEAKIKILTNSNKKQFIEIPVKVQERRDIEFKPKVISLTGANGKEESNIEITSTNSDFLLKCTKIELPDWITIRELKEESGSYNKLRFLVKTSKLLPHGLSKGEVVIFLEKHSPVKIPVLLFHSGIE